MFRSLLAALFLGVAVPAAPFCPLSVKTQQPTVERPAILLTNDDGINSPGLTALAEALGSFAEVTVVAPAGNRSGSSQSLDLHAPVVVQQLAPGRYSVDGSPAACVAVAVDLLAPDGGFDLLISGPNTVENLGADVDLSGTVGAARMAASYGVPAIAASHSFRCRDFAGVAQWLTRLAQEALSRDLQPATILNINFPAGTAADWKEAVATHPGGRGFSFHFQGSFDEQGRMECRARAKAYGGERPSGSDSRAFQEGHISISVLALVTAPKDQIALDLSIWKVLQTQ